MSCCREAQPSSILARVPESHGTPPRPWWPGWRWLTLLLVSTCGVSALAATDHFGWMIIVAAGLGILDGVLLLVRWRHKRANPPSSALSDRP
jgi:hypothetical protein